VTQSRALDNLPRLFFTFPVVREALSGEAPVGAEILTPVGGGRGVGGDGFNVNTIAGELGSVAGQAAT
jgi:hypothetical protein